MAPLPPSNRYIAPETTKVFILPAVAAADGIPTRAEITAGTEIADEINDWSGFNKQTASVPTTSVGSRFTPTIPGMQTSEDSSLTMHADKNGDDGRALFVEDGIYYVVFMDGGDVDAQNLDKLMDVYPTRCSSVSKVRNAAGTDNTKIMVSMTITRRPVENVPVPAAA